MIAADASAAVDAGLAFLVVKGVKRPPAPIDMVNRVIPTEGTAFLDAGSPSGDIVNEVTNRQGNPVVAINRGGIAKLVRDEHGRVTRIQTNAAIMAGNSGGPIVELTTGRLLGVSAYQVGSTGVAGFVIPADEVRRVLAGRAGGLGGML